MVSIPQIVTQHVVAAAVCLAGLTAAGGKRAAIDSAHIVLGFDRLGPVKVGMSVEEAERSLGIPLAPGRAHEPGECHYVQNRARLPGIAFMSLEDRIVRADVYEPGPRTAGGVEVGSTEDEVRLAYPDVAVEPHPYAEEGHTLRVEGEDGVHSIIFETDGAAVLSFRGGERGAVAAIEGCE